MIKLSTKFKKNVEERVFFVNEDDGRKITLIIGWSNGSVWTEEEFDLADYNPEEGADMGSFAGYVDEELDDGWSFDVEGDVDDKEKQEIEQAWNDSLESGMSDLGWEWSDRELWFFGELATEEE